MKIACFTPRSLDPLHPRLFIFRQFFASHQFPVTFINHSVYRPNLSSKRNWLVLWFFDLYAISRCKPMVKDYDVIIVNDLKYLPLVKFAKASGKIVIYDTIDHNVELRFYQLQQKFSAMRLFKPLITNIFRRLERHYGLTYCDEILVNSDSLARYFGKKVNTLFYSSPLESLSGLNASELPPALIYLGAFTEDKGAKETIDLCRKLDLKLFVFGNAEPAILPLLRDKNISYHPKISSEELAIKIQLALREYFLFGMSLIHAPHLSYEVQEANKDIDYLAIGAPIIGNTRQATREKIEAGCGLFFDDPALSTKIHDVTLRKTLRAQAVELYRARYSFDNFNKTLSTVMHGTGVLR